MTSDIYYTPQMNGVEGIEDFGAIGHGTNYAREHEVHVDGVKVIGPCAERAAVAEFFRVKGISPVFDFERVYDSRTPAGRVECISRLPDFMRGPTKVAKGALVFVPGWDADRSHRVSNDEVYKTAHGYSQGTHGVQHYNPLEGLFD